MNPAYLGDSFDIVKRFVVGELRSLGYCVVVDPLFTGEWQPLQKSYFYRLVSVDPDASVLPEGRKALLLDPDTGVRAKRGDRYVTFDRMAEEAVRHEIVVAFDQSYSRGEDQVTAIDRKLAALRSRGCYAMLYNSHARFLFASITSGPLEALKLQLVGSGIPEVRLHKCGT